MAFGTKTNERPGTRATARYIRIAPNKVREVLNLIRGRNVTEAEDLLALTERDAARKVAKVLAAAVANAEANDDQDPERLYVSACYADEGPTLKRFRPRARGRATTVRKRTSHITVIVSRMSDEDFARLEAGQADSAGGDRRRRVSASRAARVAKSRAKDAEKAGLADEDAPEVEGDDDGAPAEAGDVTTDEASTEVSETAGEDTTDETGQDAETAAPDDGPADDADSDDTAEAAGDEPTDEGETEDED